MYCREGGCDVVLHFMNWIWGQTAVDTTINILLLVELATVSLLVPETELVVLRDMSQVEWKNNS